VVKPTSPFRWFAVAGGVCWLRLCRRLSSWKPSLFPVLSRPLQQPNRQPGGTGSQPASRTKSFPGFVSHTAPLRPADRQNRQDEGNRSPDKNLTGCPIRLSGLLGRKQVFSRLCLAHCTFKASRPAKPPGRRQPVTGQKLNRLSDLPVRSARPPEGNKSFPGFVSHNACVHAAFRLFFGPGWRCRSVCGAGSPGVPSARADGKETGKV